jgi:hypothetical protein
VTKEKEICDDAWRVKCKSFGHGYVRFRILLAGGCRNEVVVRNILNNQGAYNVL